MSEKSPIDLVDRLYEATHHIENLQRMVGAVGHGLEGFDLEADPDGEHPRGFGLALGVLAEQLAAQLKALDAIREDLATIAKGK